ncbi:putative PFY1-profilin [Conidiobolus coronatus NRRL 28638]|uniref:Profilin n=1 Tax=Conidiobolus coronatus (strain ATCC 28846 / CBS 209.66 / NRRL 28638) TaxID=796925 RepID=A0A137PEF6_CONC2|nr:putative PFY1-profilin [Conidiobolus coronatus NRRL 28638]|eukprot:KXN73394.1 putative PFY1-profilin [Conidiobolus coronatus NRRL 28638]
MNFQNIVDTELLGSGAISQGAIIGFDASVFASSKDFDVTKEEAEAITYGFNDTKTIMQRGIPINGKEFITMGADPKSIHGKKGMDGVVCARAGKKVIIGTFEAPTEVEQALPIVQNLADKLASEGY